jgi:enoyl-CoA hydratase/carnithine racemase
MMVNVTTETRNGISIIRYANPERGYLTAEGCTQLLSAFRAGVDDANTRAIIFTGEDDVFIRHYDVSEIINAGEAVRAGAIDQTAFEAGPFADLTMSIMEAGKPVIAAINGVCMGGGFELALACDFRVAQQDVQLIGLPETRIGIFPGGGGTQRLPRLIGEARALEFILLGQTVTATDAKDIGLVHDASEYALQAALKIAEQLSERGAEALASAKKLVRSALSTDLIDGLRAEQHRFYDILKTDSAAAGMQTFMETGEDITQ